MSGGPLSRIDPDRLTERLEAVGEAWADANAAAEILEESRKPLLAELTLERMTGKVTVAQAEREALASMRYREHLQASVEARRMANRAKVKYETAKTWVELARSLNANRRAELSTHGLTA